ncbi:hypothetical protein H8M03_06635 [Sphingomonas sabuli]|uniref:Uncharacterized protein n=1 Tax=Sphingomonas sabuli TaxID=2764186 RepID=A0A7G9KZE8_9SPHN|nr:hypothetical protein [Sphingomonas sabuli]QNM81747.1 hypothetical protein H8M03_06635 [Sphingomonas sabuli]
MRRLLIASLVLALAACGRAPRPETPSVAVPQSEHTRGEIIGRTIEELVRRWGTPALQVREGTSLKLQYRSRLCVLDAYFYPGVGNAPMRVTYVDTRTRALADIDQALCVGSLDAP